VCDEVSIKFTISVGIAGFKQSYKDSTQWLDLADKALYQAKVLGKNRVILAQ
jgi:diguanylate cyclase